MLVLSGWSCEIHGTWENCDISLQWRMCCGPLWSVVRVIHANSIQKFYFWQNYFNFWGNLLNDATCKECTCYIRISYWNTFITGTWNMEKRNGNSWLPRLWVKWRRTLMMFAKISWPLWTGCMSMPAPDLMDWVRHFNWSKIIGVRLKIKKKKFSKNCIPCTVMLVFISWSNCGDAKSTDSTLTTVLVCECSGNHWCLQLLKKKLHCVQNF